MKKKCKILILTYFTHPCSHAVMENIFSKELGKIYDITWIMQGKYFNNRKVIWNNSEVILTRKLSKNFVINKIINKLLIINIIYNTFKQLKKFDIDVVLVRDLPFIVVLMNVLKKHFCFKLFYQFSAPLGDINIGFFNMNKTFSRIPSLLSGLFFNLFNDCALKAADIIFPISDYHKDAIVKNKIKKEKLVPLTMGVDLDWINNRREEQPYLSKIKGNAFWITYFGTLGFQRRTDFILFIIKEILKKNHLNTKLVLIGNTHDRQDKIKLIKLINEMNLQDFVILTGRVNKQKLQQYLWYSDLCISPIPPTDYYLNSSPTKIYESLGHGLPVVANTEIFEQRKIIQESEGGILVRYDIHEFAQGIRKLILNEDLRLEMGKKGKLYVSNNYRYDYLAKNIFPYFLNTGD